jgi:hypothetical protein
VTIAIEEISAAAAVSIFNEAASARSMCNLAHTPFPVCSTRYQGADG